MFANYVILQCWIVHVAHSGFSFCFSCLFSEPGYLDLQFDIISVVTDFFRYLGPAFVEMACIQYVF